MFKYEEKDCDVVDRTKLGEFRKRLKVWNEWLKRDKEHSIWTQIHSMLWNDAVFRSVNEARRLAKATPRPTVAFNGPVARFVDQSYVATQLLAIRRLIEKDKRGDTISLRRLIDDMKANSHLFTREIYVSHDGLAFDPTPARDAYVKRAIAAGGVGFSWEATEGPGAWHSTERMHEAFDRISVGAPGTRTRDDCIDPQIFDLLNSKLGGCHSVGKVASAFIAHAADSEARTAFSPDQRKITLDRISACHKMICQVASYIYGPLLDIASTSLLPVPQDDQFANFEKSWADVEDLPKLHEYWDEHNERIESWIAGKWVQAFKLPGKP